MTADDIEPWMIWGYYISPMMYGQNAIVMNEFLDKRWSAVRSLRGLIVFISCIESCAWTISCLSKFMFEYSQFWILKHKKLLEVLKTLINWTCSQIQIQELMHLQLGKSSLSPEDSSQMNIGSGYVLEHYLDFLFSLTSYSLQHWHFWIVSSSHFQFFLFHQ